MKAKKAEKNIKFPNLIAEMARRGKSVMSMSKEIGMEYTTLRKKINGITNFTLPEMRRIQSIFPNNSLDYLFEEQEK